MIKTKHRTQKYFSSKKDYIDKDGWHIKGGGTNPYRAKRKFINKANKQALINKNNSLNNSKDNILSASVFNTLQTIEDFTIDNDLDKNKQISSTNNQPINNQPTNKHLKLQEQNNISYQLKFPALSSRKLQTSHSSNTKLQNTNISWVNIIKQSSNTDTSQENTSINNTNTKFKKPIRKKNTKESKRRKKKELEDKIKQELYEKKRQEIINNISQTKKQD